MDSKNLLKRIVRSILDGSFPDKVFTRIRGHRCSSNPENNFNEYAKKYYRNANWDVLSPQTKKMWLNLHKIFEECKIKDIVWVGAHSGEAALALDEAFPNRRFCLIEPVPSTFQTLINNTANHQNIYCVNVAAGSTEDMRNIFIDDFSPASSFLSYQPLAIEEFPFLGRTSECTVRVKRLDDILIDCGMQSVDLLIIDVQGFEEEVLKGSKNSLAKCKIVISELSLRELYIDSCTFDSIYKELISTGFRLKYLINPIKGASGQILQIDGVFVRE